MKRFEKELQDILENDPLKLLDIKSKSSNTISPDERLISSFKEINSFFEKNEREPGKSNDIEERKLYSRLKGLREDINKVEALREYDRFDLLKGVKKENFKEIKTIDDVLKDDALGLLNKDNDNIFDLTNVPQTKEMPDSIAKRKPCKDFDNFEPLFKQCHLDLSKGERKLRPFKMEQKISQGHFFILKGIMVYVAEVGKKERAKKKTNARLRCIFENGTESNMLLRSLAASLYENGRRITEHTQKLLEELNPISSEDRESGFIYIVKPQKEREEIKGIKNLYKIGYSTIPVKKRIQNAENDPTYLMSKVSIVSEFQCYNINSQKLELLLHRFFAKSCLDVEIKDKQGKRCNPREWFIVPLPVIEEAIHLLIKGTITEHEYSIETKTIVRKKEPAS